MRRLNVHLSQLEACERDSVFALPTRPELFPGELLLLQLVATDARQINSANARIRSAIEFDHFEEDHNGEVSKRYWPDAGRAWRWIIRGRRTVKMTPFSLENLGLRGDYAGQSNARRIDPADEEIILKRVG